MGADFPIRAVDLSLKGPDVVHHFLVLGCCAQSRIPKGSIPLEWAIWAVLYWSSLAVLGRPLRS